MFANRSLKSLDTVFALLLIALIGTTVWATGTSGFAWEAAGTSIQTSLTGVVATAIGAVALLIAGGMLALNNGQITQFGSTAISIALILGMVFGGAGIIAILYPGAGAVIG